MKRALIIATLLLSGCAVGRTVDMVYSNPVSVSYEYTHWYGGERVYAMQQAENHCNRFNKHAQLAGETTLNMDRASITFNCVVP